MSEPVFDLPAYLARIGYAGPIEPTLPVLRGVEAGHSAAIAFENIDVPAGRPIRLDLGSVQHKLVQRPGQRRTLFNAYCTVQWLDGRRDRRMLVRAEEYGRVLADEFGLNLTDAELAVIMVVMERRRQDAQPGDLFA